MNKTSLQLLNRVSNCDYCKDSLSHFPRPVLQVNKQAKILIAGQAPGIKVHQSGIAFDDQSGDRLREWMGIDKATFYDEKVMAILPMAFCYPGKGKTGDLPPMKICASKWRRDLLALMPDIRLTLLIGKYAQDWHLNTKDSLTNTVKAWREYLPQYLPLPHPSPRNNIWLKKNDWFQTDVLPFLKKEVKKALPQNY
jgi:uracil-DNA glycosylase